MFRGGLGEVWRKFGGGNGVSQGISVDARENKGIWGVFLTAQKIDYILLTRSSQNGSCRVGTG